MTENIRLHNVLETIVEQTLSEQLNSLNLSCTCKRCRMDVMALTLNRLPPKYVVQEVGRTFVRAQYLNSQHRANVVKALAEAVTIVNEKRNH